MRRTKGAEKCFLAFHSLPEGGIRLLAVSRFYESHRELLNFIIMQ